MNAFLTPQDLTDLLNSEHESTEKATEVAVSVYKAAKNLAASYDAPQAQAKALISEIMAETGELSITTPAGKAMVTAPSQRVSYDWKALDALIASSEDLARILSPHRKVTQVAGSLTIR